MGRSGFVAVAGKPRAGRTCSARPARPFQSHPAEQARVGTVWRNAGRESV